MFDRYDIDDDLQLRDAMERLTTYIAQEQTKIAAAARKVPAQSAPSGGRECVSA